MDDHTDLAEICDGVHLGQNDMPVAEARSILSPGKIIGLTVNNQEHIRESLHSLPDYYGVGPFRFTSTKKNLAPVLGLDGYRRLAPEIPAPFVAIGGITPSDIASLIEAGASGVAVSSLITNSDNPKLTTETLINDIWKKIS